MSLHDASPEELERELARRRAGPPAPPEPLANPEFTRLIEVVQRRVDEAAANGYMDKAFDEDVFETAINCIYGREVFWDWVNRLIR